VVIVSELEVKTRVERLQSHERNVKMCIGGGFDSSFFSFVCVPEAEDCECLSFGWNREEKMRRPKKTRQSVNDINSANENEGNGLLGDI
jgi:hypothetical protein